MDKAKEIGRIEKYKQMLENTKLSVYLKKAYNFNYKQMMDKKSVISIFFFIIGYYIGHIALIQDLNGDPGLLLKNYPEIGDFYQLLAKVVFAYIILIIYKKLSSLNTFDNTLGSNFFNFSDEETTNLLYYLFVFFIIAFIIGIFLF